MIEPVDTKYAAWLEGLKGRRQAVWKKLQAEKKRLKKGSFDRQVQTLGAFWMEQIDCTRCAACCRSPGPLFRDRDIRRLAGEFRMKPADFTAQYLRRDEEGDYVLRELPCPFLGPDRLCRVYDLRPGACGDFPSLEKPGQARRLSQLFQDALVCPVVCRTVEDLIAGNFIPR